MFLRKLVISNVLARRVRSGLTVAAVALSVSLVVSVTTGYASVLGAVSKYVESALGSIDAQVSRQNDPHGPVSVKVVDGLRADPDVSRADGRIETVTPLLDGNGAPLEARMATVVGIDRPRDTRIEKLRLHKGKFFDTDDGDLVVVDQALAELLKLDLGSKIGLAGKRKVILTVVGVVHKPEALAQHVQTVYVPLKTAQRFMGWDAAGPGGAQVDRVYIELARGASPQAFERRWKDKLPTFDPAAKLRLTRDAREDLDKNLAVMELLSYLGGAVSMLAATFIVFSALSMGVTERQRTLAMLRAVGATRGQVGSLVVVEGLILAGAGALIGAPLGWLWVKVLAWWFNDVFAAGVFVSWGGVALGVVGSMVAALAAGALPAWQATRVSPLEAMAPDASPPRAGLPVAAAVAGVLLASIDPLVFFGPTSRVVGWFGPADPESVATNVKLVVHLFLGLPGIMFGFFLLAPLVIKIVEGGLGPVVARTFGLNASLLRQQLSTGLWRAAGTAAALMVGLAVLVVMQVQGYSALSGWKLPTKFPDLFIVATSGASGEAAAPGGPTPGDAAQTRPAMAAGTQPAAATRPTLLSTAFGLFGSATPAAPTATAPAGSQPAASQPAKPVGVFDRVASLFGSGSSDAEVNQSKPGVEVDRIKVLEKIPGIRGNEIMPIAIASPQFGHGMTSLILTAMNPEATMFFGIDPTKAFKMMELEFREGSTDRAEQFLEKGEALRLRKDQTWRPAGELAETKSDGRRVGKVKGVVLGDDGQFLVQGLVSKPDANTYRVDRPGGGPLTVPADQVEKVEHGRFLIVTNEFKQLKGLGLGDAFPLRRNDGNLAQFTIVGVVWSPGIDVIVSVFDMGRQFDQRTASSVFGSVRDAKDDFGVERIYLFAANVEPTVDREAFVKSINKALRTEGMKAGDVRQIKENITKAFDRLLLLASTVAFAALAVASLGVTNTVMAGIRTRRWQFGVLRSIGVTRDQLLRLVLAEAVLLGLVACVLGLGAGSVIVAGAHALQAATVGYDPPIAVPWGMVALGVGIVMAIAVGASVWPAVNVARTEPLKLLQAGRAST
jgi:ABC-type antimicrobial peptide transport system permease subunit